MQRKSKEPMRNVTINIPDVYHETIQKLKESKDAESVSAFVRESISSFLDNEWDFLKLLKVYDKEDVT